MNTILIIISSLLIMFGGAVISSFMMKKAIRETDYFKIGNVYYELVPVDKDDLSVAIDGTIHPKRNGSITMQL